MIPPRHWGAVCAGLLWAALPAAARQVPVTLACSSGLRAPLESGRLARFAERVRELREEERNLLVVDAGGWASGSALAAAEPELMPWVMDRIAPDALLPGILEFVEGVPSPGGRGFQDRWVCANFQFPRDGARDWPPPFRIVERDGIRVLIAGVTADPMGLWTPPGRHPRARASTMREALRAHLPAIRAAGAEVRVLLAHAPATPGDGLSRLAAEFPDFDLVVGAGESGVRPASDAGPWVVQPDAGAETFLLTTLVYDTVKRTVVRKQVDNVIVREWWPGDVEVERRIQAARKRHDPALDAPLAQPGIAGAAETLRKALALDVVVLPAEAEGAPARTPRELHPRLPLGRPIAVLEAPASALRDALAALPDDAVHLAGLAAPPAAGQPLRLADGSTPIARKRLRVGVEESLLASRGGALPMLRPLAADPAARLAWSEPVLRLLRPAGAKP